MAKYTSEDIRNVVFLGEGGNGKTSLVGKTAVTINQQKKLLKKKNFMKMEFYKEVLENIY